MNDTTGAMAAAETIAKEFCDFAYSVSHDLSSPARAVVEFSRLLLSEETAALSDDGKMYLSLIVENGEKLQTMLSGLLDYSRLNTMAKTLSIVDCNTIIEHCQIILKDRIRETGSTVEFVKLPKIKGDAEQIMQLFLMLLDNAMKFQSAGAKPRIRIVAEAKGSEWLFKVRDNGIGIPHDLRKNLFKPFQRLHTQEEYPGVGMGLALARKIVNRHGGEMGIESSDQGSVFFFTLQGSEKPHA